MNVFQAVIILYQWAREWVERNVSRSWNIISQHKMAKFIFMTLSKVVSALFKLSKKKCPIVIIDTQKLLYSVPILTERLWWLKWTVEEKENLVKSSSQRSEHVLSLHSSILALLSVCNFPINLADDASTWNLIKHILVRNILLNFKTMTTKFYTKKKFEYIFRKSSQETCCSSQEICSRRICLLI